MLITVLLFVVCVLPSGASANLYLQLAPYAQKKSTSSVLPVLWFLPLTLLFGLISLIRGEKNFALWAAIFGGACLFLAAFLLIRSMQSSQFSFSVILVNLNFLIPVILSAVFLSERPGVLQWVGTFIPVLAIILLYFKPSEKIGFIMMPVCACLSNGLLNFCIKINANAEGETAPFFAVLYLSGALCGIVAYLVFKWTEKRNCESETDPEPKQKWPLSAILSIPGMALCNGLTYWAEALLGSRVNASAQFTIVTSASILISLIIGAWFQKEKWTWKTTVALLLCLVAIGFQSGAFFQE